MKINSKITAFLLAGCIGCAFPVSAAEYMDIYEEDTAFAVSVLDALDVVEGFPDGGYHPEETLTRAQFCKMAVILLGMGEKAGSSSQKTLFSDVTSAHWAASYINLAYESGIIEGYGNGQFGPDDTLTYAQVLTIMLRMLGYADTEIGTRYPDDQMRIAESIGLTEQIWLNAGDSVTRGDTARLLLTLLETETKSGSPYYKTIAARSAEEIVLLDNSDTSSSGKSDCVKVYENGQAVWYQKSDEYAEGVVGAEGTALLDENGKILVFLPSGTEYSLIDGILLANNQRSDNDAIPYEIVLYDPWMEESDTYLRTNSISANLVGSTGTLLVDEYGYAVSFLSADTDSYTLVRNAVLLDAYNEDDTAVFYINGKETLYELSYSSAVYESYEGYTGTILTDDDEEIYAFVPEEKEYSIEYGILMRSDNDEAVFLINGYMEELAITGTISSSLAGYAGTVLINDDGEAVLKTHLSPK